MVDWFARQSGVRKFLLVWNAVMFPILLGVIVAFVLFSGQPFMFAAPVAVAVVLAAAAGFTIVWSATKPKQVSERDPDVGS